MQLQYVLANPAHKKGKKKAKRVHKKPKASNIKHVGGKAVAKKKHGRFKKGSKEAKAWGRRMKALRAKGNPKRKRGKAKRNASGYVLKPKYTKTRFNYPDKEVIDRKLYDAKFLREGHAADRRQLESMSALDLMMQKKKVRQLQAENRALERAAKSAEAAKNRRDRGIEKNKQAESEGGKVIITKGNAMAKRRKKHKKAKARKHRKAKRNPVVKMKQVKTNPRRRKRKHARKAKKGGNELVKFVGRGRISKKSAKAIARKRRLGVAVSVRRNPSLAGMLDTAKGLAIPAAYAAGGYLAINFLIIPLIDKHAGSMLPGGSIAGAVAKIPVVGQYAAPYAGSLIGAGVGIALASIAPKYIKNAEISRTVRIAGMSAAGLAVTLIALDIMKKYALPTVAKAAGLSGAGLGGVMYFPNHGMGSADFGMYPQMGDGYRQQPGDFGIIPSGMGVIPAGLRGVEFFPNRKGLGEVQFYPDGSDGDEMYQQSEAGDLLEAEGLGSADFGIIPSGMGEEGQMG